jgi:hypothetical protein
MIIYLLFLEQVPPYRITYTSTLTVNREIVIDGVIVYRNSQRTLDVSLPMICHGSASS